MYLQEVVIEGFKSYAQRTVISGWDQQFNAITGLNGSGKSNILDAICFVLGITNLSQVRASNLQDLIYKQGQAGVTKASVTLVFNNSDPKTSPVGQELCDTISVTRQIVMGGRNKYMINGYTVEASKVADMFQSVGLNVNNPHFLIMQGRITKVLNMKPPEILGLIEEAAGTRMFEAKKQAALKTIEKKQAKVEEITKVLDDDITPQLKKLREERAAYLKWAANNTEVERLAKFCVAWEFTAAERTKGSAGAQVAELAEAAKADLARAKDFRAAAAAKAAEISALQDKLAASRGGELAALGEDEARLARELAQATAAAKHKGGAAGEEDKARVAAERALKDADAALAALSATLTKQRAEGDAAAKTGAERAAEVATLQARLTAVTAGMAAEAGAAGGAGSSSGTAADQLIAAKSRLTALNAELAQRDMKVKHLTRVAKDAAAAAKAAEKDAKGLQAALDKAKAVAEAKAAELARLGFDPAKDEQLRATRDALASKVASLSEAHDSEWEALAAAAPVECAFDRRAMAAALGPAWDAATAVKGTVAQLATVKRPEAAQALESMAGGRLFQVVVDNEVTAKELIKPGRTKRRITAIPLNQIKPATLSADRVAAAASLSGGKAVPALSLVSHAPDVTKAVEFAFGGGLVCDDKATANALAADKRVAALCVTLGGDVYDPAGTLEGGAPAGGAGGEPLLLRMQRVAGLAAQRDAARAQLADVENTLAGMAGAAKAFAALSEAAELAGTEARLMAQRLAASSLGASTARLEAAQTELAAEEAGIAAAQAALRDTAARVKDLEAEVKNAAAAREARIAAVEADLAKARKAAAAAEAAAKKLAQAAEASALELDAAQAERATLAAAVAEREDAAKKAAAAADAARAAVDKATAAHAEAKAKLAAAKEAIAAADKMVRQLVKERDAALSSAEDAEAEAKAKDAQVAAVKRDAAAADKKAADLLSKHPWITAEKPFFDRPHSDYDFSRSDPAKASSRLAELEKQQSDLERRINKKVMGMIDAAEREYHDLRTKKGIIENDKAKIEKVIGELDEKKNEALRTTWAKVNKDFGSIFATLLPGVTAKLEPTDSGDVLDGLEVKVSFNGVWKESLTELSGGQRSLLALSLILALLLFKPAPMYILDEVDAALDLSHTQNIGHMIRTHFSRSQFIVVSLKQGMFSNANVIFRTKFVEGTSTVIRTVPAGSALAGGAGARPALRDVAPEEDDEGAGGAGGKKGGKGAGGGAKSGKAAAAGGAGI